MKKSDPNSPPTLRDICLDEIGAIAAEIAKNSPTPLSKAQSIALAARTPAGYSAYNWYRSQFSHLPVAQAVTQIVNAELTKAATKKAALPSMAGGRTATAQPVVTRPPASAITITSPAQAIYGHIHAAALEAFPGIQEAVAVSRFVATPEGEQLNRQYSAAKRIEQG